MDLNHRADTAELMDAPDLDSSTYERSLLDLEKLNRLTWTHKPTLRWLSQATAKLPKGSKILLLDIGYGRGDLLRSIYAWAIKEKFEPVLVGIDLNPRSAIAARAATQADLPITFLTGDIFKFEPVQKFDFIVTSQFAHHLSNTEVGQLLRWMDVRAELGWHVVDLHRNAVAYYGFPWLARLCGWHPIVRHDGAVSITRGFRQADWIRILAETNLKANICWHWAFRHSLSHQK